MLNKIARFENIINKTAKISLKIGFGFLLCANYSCSSTDSIVGKDPFSKQQGPIPGSSAQVPHGNHSMLEQSSFPLDQSPAATMPLAHGRVAPAGYQQPVPQKKNEWPAVPEQRIGVAPPQMTRTAGLEHPPLPPGGYQKPIGQPQSWTEPMARITSPPASNNAVQVNFEEPQKKKEVSNRAPDFPGQTQLQPESISEQIKQVAFQAPAEAKPHGETFDAAFQQAANFTPAEPRIPLNQVSATAKVQLNSDNSQTCPPAMPVMLNANSDYDPAFYPDEYLCDGGDRNLPVHYSPGFREGLDTQDTIAEYQDDQGKQHVKKSNQVCVYAPRFAAVTTTAGISENLSIDRALGAYETVNGLAMNTRIKPNLEKQTDQIKAARVRTRVSGLESENITLGVNQTTKLEKHTKLVNTNTDYAFSGLDKLDRWQSPVSMGGIQAAAVWTRKLSPVIIASDTAGSEVYSSFRPEEMVGLKEKHQSKGEIYIDKSADKTDAAPGDVITFTIRYKNTGDRSLNNVVVIDNLTPRLEFIEGTGTSDRDGRLVVEDNLEGSLILKWEIEGELKGHTGGTLSFQAKVR